MTDSEKELVKRLRLRREEKYCGHGEWTDVDDVDCYAAADAIERLSAQVAEMKEHIADVEKGSEQWADRYEKVERERDEARAELFDLEAHLTHQAHWSAMTFGPGDRAQGIMDHIVKELCEVLRATSEQERQAEWIDVVILALDGAWRSGMSPKQIVDGIVAKQRKNEARTWPDWRTADPGKAIEHVRELEAKP